MRTPQGLNDDEWGWLRVRHPMTCWFFLHYPAAVPAGHQNIRAYDRAGLDWARLVWKVCHECRRGVIAKISLTPDVQRRGLGRLLIERALLDGPDYRWTTSAQSPDGKAFFQAMSARTGAEFKELARTCQHISQVRAGHSKATLDRHLQRAARRVPQPGEDQSG